MHKSVAVITASLPSIAADILSELFDVVTHENDPARSEEDLVTLFSEADGVVTVPSDRVTRRVLESNPNLRIVANCGPGTGNIDLEAAKELGVTVTNVPSSSEDDSEVPSERMARVAALNVKMMLTGKRPPDIVV